MREAPPGWERVPLRDGVGWWATQERAVEAAADPPSPEGSEVDPSFEA